MQFGKTRPEAQGDHGQDQNSDAHGDPRLSQIGDMISQQTGGQGRQAGDDVAAALLESAYICPYFAAYVFGRAEGK